MPDPEEEPMPRAHPKRGTPSTVPPPPKLGIVPEPEPQLIPNEE